MGLKMKNIVSFMIMMEILFRAAGILTNKTSTTVCQGLTANIDFTIDLQGSTIGTGSSSWYFRSKRIATNAGGSFTPQGNYTSRLSSYLTYGVSLTNVTLADEGEYSILFAVILPVYEDVTANASLTVNVPPARSCVPYYILTGNTGRCFLNQTALSNMECGSPVLQTNWTNGLLTSDITNIATSGNYTCCAYGIARNCYNGSYTFCETFSITVSTTTATQSTITTTTTTVPSSSTSMSSATSSATIDQTSTNLATNGSATTSSTSTSMIPTAVVSVNNTNNTSTSTKPTSNKSNSDSDIKVIVPAVVVPCGLLTIGGILLVVCCVRPRAGKNVRESPDGMAVQDKGNNIEGWKQSLGHDKATDKHDTVYTTHDGFVIYPGPATRSTARSYKKHHDGTDQYNRPYPGTYHHQAAYIPSIYKSVYTHKDKKYYVLTDQYSRPSTGTYDYQGAYVPNTYKSDRTYAQRGKKSDYEGPIHQQAFYQMATGRPDYDQATYYPQTGYCERGGEDVYYSGGEQYSFGQRSRSHHDHSVRKQKQDYNQYEMADYGGNRTRYGQTKQYEQNTTFCY